MILEWLSREGGIILSWWALVTIAGAAALPLCMRLLGGLPDRGYTLARAAGVLLVAFVYWLLASLGFLRNTSGGMLLAWVIVLVASVALFFHGPRIDVRAWWRENRTVVIAAEVLFVVLFFGWCVVRAYQNSLLGTEKDMELAFISGTMRSETFPPNDPWLAGYAISYYYFGYVITAMLSMLSGVSSTVGFNLIAATTLGMAGLGAFGVVYNLVRSGALATVRHRIEARRSSAAADGDEGHQAPSRRAAVLVGLLGTIFLLFLSNYQLIFIELPYQTGTASRDYLEFFSSKDRLAPMLEGYSDFADWDGGGNFWWHGARVLYDTNLDGSRNEIIDEFPQFSFILADNHPHVLALPYALLALGLALNTLLLWRSPTRIEIVLYSVFLGGLIFLNTWDGPIYMAAVVGADGLRRLIGRGNARLALRDFRELAVLALSLLALSAVFYLPFLVNFRSQAGGLLPNIANPTLFSQFFVMWGPFLLLLTPFLLVEARRAGDRMNWKLGLQIALLVFALLAGAMLALAIIGSIVPSIRDTVLAYIQDNGGWGAVLPAVLSTRIANFLTTLVLLALLALAAGRLFARQHQNEAAEPTHDPLEAHRSGQDVVTYLPSTGFALLLICLGALLTLAPEYIYLRDVFGSRMNTVFKFYYQAWVLWSVAGAYGVYAVFSGIRRPSAAVRLAYAVFALVVIGLGLLNPILSIYQRTFIESGRIRGIEPTVTLDGASSFIRTGYISQDDYEALTCLGQTVQGDDAVVAEAYGNSYNWGKGRTGTLTGIPILFNWGGHQSQWRGSTYGETVGTRQQDIDLLYEDPTWNSAQQIIDRYGIDYVFFGTIERQQYGADAETKFADHLEVVCERGSSRYYRVSAVEVPAG